MKSEWNLGCTGHINLARIEGFDEDRVRTAIDGHIENLCKSYRVKLYCGCADGADMLFAQAALRCGAALIAVLPCEREEFAAEHGDGGAELARVLSKAEEILIERDEKVRYLQVSKTIAEKCDELLALWDGVELPLKDEDGNDVNLGGTFDTVRRVREAQKKITLF